ncbi:cytochrome-c peroxidase [uncultured Croceitalea sp.]|uniref:cytochrome-c peroxidase n=1 Tax=uncultured Croceitalea sp. TaxID=1798908 RepID=UPI00374FCE9E
MNKLSLLVATLLIVACKSDKKVAVIEIDEKIKIDWEPARQYYFEHMTDAIHYIDTLGKISVESEVAKKMFIKMRTSFKKAEAYGAYLNPEVGHRVNGPALPILTEDTQKILLPVGIQKIEESIYDGPLSQERYLKELSITKGMLSNLARNIKEKELNPQRFFIAIHQQLMRILSLSLSGFDSPLSKLGINEAGISLSSLKDVYQLSLKRMVQEKYPKLDIEFQERLKNAIDYTAANSDFESFDRFTFIKNYFNDVMRTWIAIRKELDIWNPIDNKPFNFNAETFFDEDAFNVNFFADVTNKKSNKTQIALGEKLFFDNNLSKGAKMSCATCHNPKKGWADDMVMNVDNNGKPLKRNTPTIINAAFQQSFFWDGRASNLMDQITSVFTNEQEFDSSVHQFSNEILIDSTYTQLFIKAYGGVSTKNTDIIKALSAYIGTLKGFNSKFDKNMRGEENTFTDEEKLGFNIYMGKALCATCHFIPLTNGTVPPFFSEHEKEVIGVPETKANKVLDDDLGIYWLNEKEVQKGMFKTPTVRNTEQTAPYMHNGVYETLEEVIDFYNKGGGAGLGFDLPYQTLPFDKLNLTEKEENALVAFVKTLTNVEIETY